jgi:hypothetical protein
MWRSTRHRETEDLFLDDQKNWKWTSKERLRGFIVMSVAPLKRNRATAIVETVTLAARCDLPDPS